MENKTFAEGIYFDRHEKAPDFVKGNISINVAKFTEWLAKQPKNEKGYVKLDVKVAKNGKNYIELNTYKPQKQDNSYIPDPNTGPVWNEETGGFTAF